VNAAQLEIDALTKKRASLIGSGDRSVAEAQLREGQAAVADVPNYATGGVTFLYTEVEEIV